MQEGGELSCSRLSYIQMGGNAFGYSILIAMIGVGVLAVGSGQDTNFKRMLACPLGSDLVQHCRRDRYGIQHWNSVRAGGRVVVRVGSVVDGTAWFVNRPATQIV